MSEHKHIKVVALFVGALGLAACQEGQDSPTRPSIKPQYFSIQIVCSADPTLICTAQRYTEGDITTQVEWFASSTPFGDPDASVTFPTPGVPVPTRLVQMYIRARRSGEANSSSHSYEIAPGAKPIPLAALSGFVSEGEPGTTGVGDATVEIIEGEGNAGRTATTAVNGFFLMHHVRIVVPFTIRASKIGYEPSVHAHAGIMDHPEGFPDAFTTVVHFRLKRLR